MGSAISGGGGGGISQSDADTRYLNTTGDTATGPLLVTMGTGSGTATVGGVYAKFVSAAGVGNAADTTDDPLWTLTAIPANSFTANGDALVLTLSMKTGATVNNKRVGVTVGGTQVNTSNVFATNTGSGVVTVTITRVDATHVNVVIGGAFMASGSSTGIGGSNVNLLVSDLAVNTLAVVVTGISPTAGAANDIVLYSGVAEWKK